MKSVDEGSKNTRIRIYNNKKMLIQNLFPDVANEKWYLML